jgi:hypothetical protein
MTKRTKAGGPADSERARAASELLRAFGRPVLVHEQGSGRLYLSGDISDWEPLDGLGVSAIVDLDAGLDRGVPERHDGIVYVYMPIYDEELPNAVRLQAVANLCGDLITAGHGVLVHCRMGLNRSALLAGLVVVRLGWDGKKAVERIAGVRPGALNNERFREFLENQ